MSISTPPAVFDTGRTAYLADDRMIQWEFHEDRDPQASFFRLERTLGAGVKPIADDEGRALLYAASRQANGDILGPVRLPPPTTDQRMAEFKARQRRLARSARRNTFRW